MSWIAIGVGVVAAGAGTAMSASGASKRRGQLGKLADTPGVDVEETQAETIAANERNLAAAQRLGDKVNVGNQEALLKALRSAIPNFDKLVGKSSDYTSSLLGGELPQEVQDLVVNARASRNVATGLGGSPRGNNLVARDLGLTKLQLQSQGFDSAMRWLSFGRSQLMPPQFDVTSMMVSPSQALSLKSKERTEYIQTKQTAYMQPTSGEVWGNFLQQTGGAIAGYGAGQLNPNSMYQPTTQFGGFGNYQQQKPLGSQYNPNTGFFGG